MGLTVGELLDRTAARFPDNPALIVRHQNKRYTYREFLREVERAARGLLRLGIQKGERVGIWSTNYAEWVDHAVRRGQNRRHPGEPESRLWHGGV